jgi:hypothetical protein
MGLGGEQDKEVRYVVPPETTILRGWVFASGLAAWVFAVVMAFHCELLWAAAWAVFALGANRAHRVNQTKQVLVGHRFR